MISYKLIEKNWKENYRKNKYSFWLQNSVDAALIYYVIFKKLSKPHHFIAATTVSGSNIGARLNGDGWALSRASVYNIGQGSSGGAPFLRNLGSIAKISSPTALTYLLTIAISYIRRALSWLGAELAAKILITLSFSPIL